MVLTSQMRVPLTFPQPNPAPWPGPSTWSCSEPVGRQGVLLVTHGSPHQRGQQEGRARRGLTWVLPGASRRRTVPSRTVTLQSPTALGLEERWQRHGGTSCSCAHSSSLTPSNHPAHPSCPPGLAGTYLSMAASCHTCPALCPAPWRPGPRIPCGTGWIEVLVPPIPRVPPGPGWMQVLLLRVMAHPRAPMGSPGQAGRCPADAQSRERGCAPETAPQKLQQLLRGWGVPGVTEKVELLPLAWAGAALPLLCCLIPAVGSRRSWLNCDPSLCSPPRLASWDPPLSHGCLHLSCNRSDTGDLGTFSAPAVSQYIVFPLEIWRPV